MTPRELDLLLKAFEAFLGGEGGERFMLTNRSMKDLIVAYAGHLRGASPDQESQEKALEHVVEHGAAERERLLNDAHARGDVVNFHGQEMIVLTESSAAEFRSRKPPPHPWVGGG